MGSSTITSKGQITLPSDIRKEFDLRAGDRLVFFRALSGDLRLHISRKTVGSGRGVLRAEGAPIDRDAIGEAVVSGVETRGSSAARPRKRA